MRILSVCAVAVGSMLGAVVSAAPASFRATSALSTAADEAQVEEARKLAKSGQWEDVVRVLEEHLRFSMGDEDTHRLLGDALARLGRPDEAAHHYGLALDIVGEGKGRSSIERAMRKVDPLARKRDDVLEKIAKTLLESARKLYRGGHTERCLELLERIRPIATGKELAEAGALIDSIRAATIEVDLDRSASDGEPSGGWPLFEHETDHYVLKCNLEPEVVYALATTMDDLHAYFVQIFFDGDERRAKGRSPTIRIHSSRERMLEEWQGESTPAGWWSPGEWRIVTYDTRDGSGSLDFMLEVLFHEASHHFMALFSRGGNTPAWLNEGTACFFEGARAMADSRVLWPDAAYARLQSLNGMLGNKGGGGPNLRSTISFNEGGSYGGEFYPWGWGLVFYMQQYEDPDTLEYVYRPLYSQYRETIIKKGEPLELFEEVFLGPKSPSGIESLDQWGEHWRSWIQETVHPLHFGGKRRELRLAEIEKYMEAADKAAKKKKAPVTEEDLLMRALGHVEFIRTRIDGPEEQDPRLILQQADIMERLGRPESAAPLLEQAIALAGSRGWEPSDEEVSALVDRLFELDSQNAALRAARARAASLSSSARAMIDAYRDAKHPMLLRSYTFAKLAGTALKDEEVLLPLAAELRKEAKEAGLLRGSSYKLNGSRGSWTTIFSNTEDEFSHSDSRLVIGGVRPVGKITLDVPITGEYQIRAKMKREGDVTRASFNGVVFAGTAGGDWLVAGVDGLGRAMVRRLVMGEGGGVTDRAFAYKALKPMLRKSDDAELVVHVLPAENRVTIQVGDRDPIPFRLPLPVPSLCYAGVYAKDSTTVLEGAVVEILP